MLYNFWTDWSILIFRSYILNTAICTVPFRKFYFKKLNLFCHDVITFHTYFVTGFISAATNLSARDRRFFVIYLTLHRFHPPSFPSHHFVRLSTGISATPNSRLPCLTYCCEPVLKSGWVEGGHIWPTVNFNLRLAHDRNDKQNYEDGANHYGQSVYHGRLFVQPWAEVYDGTRDFLVHFGPRARPGANDLMQNNGRRVDTRSRLPHRRH